MMPLNANGDREYATVILEIDAPEHGGAKAQVRSERRYMPRLEEDALKLVMAAHGDGRNFHHPDTEAQLQSVREVDAAYVYMPRGQSERLYVVMGSGGYRELIDHPQIGRGSNLLADEWIGELVADMLAERGGSLCLEVVDLSAEMTGQASSSSTAGKPLAIAA